MVTRPKITTTRIINTTKEIITIEIEIDSIINIMEAKNFLEIMINIFITNLTK